MKIDATPPLPDQVTVLIVGAGVTGLTAARQLVTVGHEVLVLDKGWNPGGRMATRKMGEASFDHGTTFLAPVGGQFAEALSTWGAIPHSVRSGGLPIRSSLRLVSKALAARRLAR